MSKSSTVECQYCSWCFEKTEHQLIKQHYLTRNDYQCSSCGNYTVQCRFCQNMATYKPKVSRCSTFIDSIKENWASECCAEHDGTVANFSRLDMKLADISDYQLLFETKKWNLAKGGKVVGGMLAGTAVFGPLAYLAAPSIAATLGSWGLLGTASTGEAISLLSGAALTSASLVALGPGGVGGGIAFISAIGAGLGGIQGGAVSNSYFGDVEDFKIVKVRDGEGPALIYINGFLKQKEQDSSDWQHATFDKYPKNPIYYVTWESGTLEKLGKTLGTTIGRNALKDMASVTIRKGARATKGLSWVSIMFSLLGNPWHTSMVKASMTGILLADIIARTEHKHDYILMGHSLGARVIYYLLEALGTKKEKFIQDVYLLGGAVARDDKSGWARCTQAVKGNIYNFYSDEDQVLNILYRGASAFTSEPIGLGDINYQSKQIINKDASDIVKGHMKYKKNFKKLLEGML